MKFFSLLALFLVAQVSPLWSCTVCFNGSSPELVRGFFWGILLLLILPFLVMGTLFGLVYFHSKKHKNLNREPCALK